MHHGHDSDTSVTERLARIPDVDLATSARARQEASRDFGGLCAGDALAVARPKSVEALREIFHAANTEGFEITPRGVGYSQSGQSVPVRGCAVDLSAFDEITVNADQRVVTCGAGASWRRVLERTAAYGLAPLVMPGNLDVTIGGTLSAGGVGSTSHRYGWAVSAVDQITVVTGGADIVLAGRSERRDVFDAVLGGVGHFGVIASANIQLRPLLPKVRTFYLLYDEAGPFLADQRRLMNEPWCHHLEGFGSAAIQGLRRGPAGRRVPFARWFYGLQVSVEYGEHGDRSAPRAEDLLVGLHHREIVLVDDAESIEFAGRYEARFQMMRATGAWQQPHPWLECVLPFDVAADVIPAILHELPLFLGDGHRIMVIADSPLPALFARPSGVPTVGLTVLPTGVAPMFHDAAMGALRAAHETLLDAGGKRYLSGWLFEPDEAAWRAHFGDRYEAWRARKGELDPRGVLRSRLLSSP